MKHRIWAAWLCLLLGVCWLMPAAAEGDRAAAMMDALLEAECRHSGVDSLQEWIDGELTQTAGVSAEWYAFTLSRLGRYDFSNYRAALEASLAQGKTLSAATRMKNALTLAATGAAAEEAQALLPPQSEWKGVMCWVYGLHLLDNGIAPGNAQTAVAQLLALQLEDGGWAVSGSVSDVDVTAMVMQALAAHRDEAAVVSALERALQWLETRQWEDGSFASYGVPSTESTAQVIIALCTLGIDPMKDERFISSGRTLLDALENYRLEDGRWSHTSGGAYHRMATIQALQGLAAYQRLLAGQPGLYTLERTQDISVLPDGGEASAVAVIGGADGPTAIFVTTDVPAWKLIAAAVVFVLTALAWFWLKRSGRLNRKNQISVVLIALALILLLMTLDIQSPDSYYGSAAPLTGEPVGSVTLEIRCDVLKDRREDPLIPEDGCILPRQAFPIAQGDTVFQVLTRAAQQYRLQLDASGGEGMRYVTGLAHLYEQAYGELSGWMFFVNGQSASVGCDQLTLSDGDQVLWQYTCEMGKDLE